MLKESFDSNSRNKPCVVSSGGPAAIHSNWTLPLSSTLTIMEGGPKEETIGVTKGDNNRSSIWIRWSISPLWVCSVRKVQTRERKFSKGKYKSKNYIEMEVRLCSEKGSSEKINDSNNNIPLLAVCRKYVIISDLVKQPSLSWVSSSSGVEHPKYSSEGRRFVSYWKHFEFFSSKYACVIHWITSYFNINLADKTT